MALSRFRRRHGSSSFGNCNGSRGHRGVLTLHCCANVFQFRGSFNLVPCRRVLKIWADGLQGAVSELPHCTEFAQVLHLGIKCAWVACHGACSGQLKVRMHPDISTECLRAVCVCSRRFQGSSLRCQDHLLFLAPEVSVFECCASRSLGALTIHVRTTRAHAWQYHFRLGNVRCGCMFRTVQLQHLRLPTRLVVRATNANVNHCINHPMFSGKCRHYGDNRPVLPRTFRLAFTVPLFPSVSLSKLQDKLHVLPFYNFPCPCRPLRFRPQGSPVAAILALQTGPCGVPAQGLAFAAGCVRQSQVSNLPPFMPLGFRLRVPPRGQDSRRIGATLSVRHLQILLCILPCAVVHHTIGLMPFFRDAGFPSPLPLGFRPQGSPFRFVDSRPANLQPCYPQIPVTLPEYTQTWCSGHVLDW